MRRGVGIAGLKNQQAVQQKMKEVGNEIEKAQLEEMNKQLIEFKNHLENFAIKYKKEINSNPVFRNQFLKMCKEIGVDPLSCKEIGLQLFLLCIANKGFWVDVLGVGDFYYELAIQIVNICIALRKKNGGFLEENECLHLLKKVRGSKSQEVSLKDMRKAVDSLHKIGSDFKIIHTGNKRVICSVSVELSQDNMMILQFAEENNGWVTFSKLKSKVQHFQQKDRFNRAMDQLIKEGLAWVDNQPLVDTHSQKGVFANNQEDEGKVYWFPSIMEGFGKGKEEAEDLALINRQQQ